MNTDPSARCPQCDKPLTFCVCDRITPETTRTRVLILQHPREQDRDYGTAPIVLTMLPSAQKRVGLSWASLSAAVGDPSVDPHRWAVLYPHSLLKNLPPSLASKPVLVLDRHGDEREDPLPLDGFIVLDGSWSQAKSIWWRNPWLLKLNRAVLHPTQPSIYGRLRREPRNDALSTLESIAELLVSNGENPSVRDSLRRVFRTMVQRARDATRQNVTAPPPQDSPQIVGTPPSDEDA